MQSRSLIVDKNLQKIQAIFSNYIKVVIEDGDFNEGMKAVLKPFSRFVRFGFILVRPVMERGL